MQYVGIMPKSTSLTTFIENADASKINGLLSKLKEVKLENFNDKVITKITGYIPVFNFDYELPIMDNLKELGVTNLFDLEKADLSNLTTSRAYISDMLHNANIDFSNNGIKAAAATVAGGKGAGGCGFDYLYDVPVEEIDLTFDKPYMFLIRNKDTGEVWFTGTVYEPTEYNPEW